MHAPSPVPLGGIVGALTLMADSVAIRAIVIRVTDTRRRNMLDRLGADAEAGALTVDVIRFVQDLLHSTAGAADEPIAREAIDAVIERHLCLGKQRKPRHDLVRVVPVVSFLFNFSDKFADLEDESLRKKRINREISKLEAILGRVNRANVRFFLDEQLRLRGTLRHPGNPLWLTLAPDVEYCAVCSDYITRLTLTHLAPTEPLFRFDVAHVQIGRATNLRVDHMSYDPRDTMSVHLPQAVDALGSPAFVPGGTTAGGAREFVSKVNNTDVISSVRIIR